MTYKRSWIYAPVSVGAIGAAYLTNHPQMVTAGLATLGCGLADCLGYLDACNRRNALTALPLVSTPEFPVDSNETSSATDLIQHMLDQNRAALLLRPEIVENLTAQQVAAAQASIQQKMSLVPPGEIRLGAPSGAFSASADPDDLPEANGTVVQVGALLLDRFCVTNQDYSHFVAAGAYEQMAIWDAEIWPGVLDFTDQTGVPGPRFWKDGAYLPGTARHPVVGVSWYEAVAYARWSGKRLPTDPEWEKAASWPTQLTAHSRTPRRFPWGDTIEPGRANLWGSGVGATVPVDAYLEGASVGGVQQLVGNVWEWTASNFGAWGFPTQDLVLTAAFRSLRGGAYDTYFENHATCQFQSGEDPMARRINIGFRCAVCLCDVVLSPPPPPVDQVDEPQEPCAIDPVEVRV